MYSRSKRFLSSLLLVLMASSCTEELLPVLSVYVVTYTLETQGNVTITNAEYLAPDGTWTDVPANQTNWADFFTFSGGRTVGFRATGSIDGAGFIRMTARGTSTNNVVVDLSDICTGTTGTMQCNLSRQQVLQ